MRGASGEVELLTTSEAARLLGISERSVRALISSGLLWARQQRAKSADRLDGQELASSADIADSADI